MKYTIIIRYYLIILNEIPADEKRGETDNLKY
uniref:Uncharacterized protein n=1 Tax=viral metagenome TaxID=1070528 RepID=A0A6C0LPY0_9ZZZZ